ncbi:hypothetical protein [Sphingomonas sp. UYEF23]|uniref:hypothetical protein n=1 Tax=Sphingomonas sp. UYEF23 TaxID=1756408 RepID=UPI0033960DD5
MIDDNVHLTRFVGHLSFLRDKINERSSYLGVVIGTAIFTFSLFLPWSQARTTSDLEDAGYSSGWQEAGYLAMIPLIFIIYIVIRDKKISPNIVLLLSAISLIIITIANVADRSVWISKEYKNMVSESGSSWKYDTGISHNSGSDLGIGFWIGLIAILSIEACGMSWTLHKIRSL